MAGAAHISQIQDQSLGKFLQIVFSDGVRNQISEDYRDWEMIEKQKQSDANGRSQRFFFQSSFGPAAVGYAAISSPGAFPASQQVSVAEYEAFYKEMMGTIELEYNLWDRARRSPAKYAEPLAIEIASKATAMKRRLAADVYGSGTGVLGTVQTAANDLAFANGKVTVTIQNSDTVEGHVGWFEFGDKVAFYSTAGVIHDGIEDTNNVSADYFIVVGKDRAAGTVTLQGYDDAADTLLVLLNNDGDTGTSVANGDVLMRLGQTTKDHSSIAVTDDYNRITEVPAGLESLTADDGRLCHGITMSGAVSGSRYDASAAALDVAHIQAAMSEVKVNVGEGKYAWPMMCMAPEANNALIESRETDRRFQSVADNKRGVNKFVYVHGQDQLEVITSEFVPRKRIYMLPEAKSGQGKVVEFWGSDFESVKPGGSGSEFFLAPSATDGRHDRLIRSYLQGYVTFVCKHPRAVSVIHNFTS